MAHPSVPVQPALTCRCCGRDFTAMTDEQRAEYHDALWSVLSRDIDYRAYDLTRDLTQPVSSERTPAYVIGAATAYVRFLVAADRGMCAACASYFERPTR